MENTKSEVSRCPNCNSKLNAHAGINHDDKPAKDDISICFHCGKILAFNEDTTVRAMSESEIANIESDTLTEILSVQEFIVSRLEGRERRRLH
jgi:uncharacterized protein with PIN domain